MEPFSRTDTSWRLTSLEAEFPVSDASTSTIQRQRRELQLLMAELKDRDRELNTMAASHQKQLVAWQQDRQRALGLEQKCVRLDEELQQRDELIRVLTRRVCVVETREEEAQKQLSELEHKHQHLSHKCQDFEEKNQSLSSTVVALSTQVGSLQVKEEELSSMLKLKDRDVTEASSRVLDLTGRLRDVDTSAAQSRSRENRLLRDVEETRRRYREAKQEVSHLREQLQQQAAQSGAQREETIRLKQELQLLRRDLASSEGDSWKDELLELARSKQERTASELRCLQQVCENQRNDLQLLQLNMDGACRTLKERTAPGFLDSQDRLTCGCAKTSGHSVSTSPANGSLGVSALVADGGDALPGGSLHESRQAEQLDP